MQSRLTIFFVYHTNWILHLIEQRNKVNDCDRSVVCWERKDWVTRPKRGMLISPRAFRQVSKTSENLTCTLNHCYLISFKPRHGIRNSVSLNDIPLHARNWHFYQELFWLFCVDSVQLVFEKHTIYFLSSKTYIVIIMIINYMVEIYYGAPSELNSLLQGNFFVWFLLVFNCGSDEW